MPGVKGTVTGAKGDAQPLNKKRGAQVDAVEDGGLKPAKKAKVQADGAKASSPAKSNSPHAPGAASSDTEVLSPEAYRKAHDISVKAFGAGSPELWQRFEDAPLPDKLQVALKAAGFKAPSPIQVSAQRVQHAGRLLNTRTALLTVDAPWRLSSRSRALQPAPTASLTGGELLLLLLTCRPRPGPWQ